MGFVQRIEPGAINLMAAGCGIVHSERVPADIRADQTPVHGIQIWLALPAASRNGTGVPSLPGRSLPVFAAEGVSLRLLIGAAFGLVSPVIAYSPTFQADIELAAGATLDLPPDYPERGVYLAGGRLRMAGTRLNPVIWRS
ncbi:MAG: pirin family protein [Candidatus Competibacteraceae bacterium]|nr:pirin family protein [Candidatus Competibacteraceae bacterium]